MGARHNSAISENRCIFWIPAKCEVAHTSPPVSALKVPIATSVCLPGGEQMAPKPDRLAFILMVLAIVATTVMITAWAAQDWATTIPPTETIYRPQHSNLF